MMAAAFGRGRRFLVPEVIQTSSMDCGPAALSALLEGWRVPVSYGRLREACQTDTDGTSIDRLEELARQLGLDAEQVMMPVDHLFMGASDDQPGIVIVRLPMGALHFVVYWRTHGDVAQIMDPARGRQLRPVSTLIDDLFVHTQAVPVPQLLEWLSTDGFRRPLRLRMAELNVTPAQIEDLLRRVDAQGGWRPVARLDAAIRLTKAMMQAGAVRRGHESHNLIHALMADDHADVEIPDTYWSMQRAPDQTAATDSEEELVMLRGTVAVLTYGRLRETAQQRSQRMAAIPTDLRHALNEPRPRPFATLFSQLPRPDRAVLVLVALGVMAGSALQLGLDVLFRGTLHLTWYMRTPLHRLAGFALALFCVFCVCGITLSLLLNTTRLGRHIEVRLRATLLEKLPKLNERYFHSRPVSDMAERAHSLLRVRQFLSIGQEALRMLTTTALMTLALLYLLPGERGLIAALFALMMSLPFLLQPWLVELDLRVRTYAGTLSRVFLDTLVGLVPIRTHSGERAMASQFEEYLADWARVRLRWLRAQVSAQGLQLTLGYGLLLWLVARYLGQGGSAAGLLLLVYWAMALPAAGMDFAALVQQYPDVRSVTLRLLEPLGAPTESEQPTDVPKPRGEGPADLILLGVTVVMAGRRVLQDLTLDLPAGLHVAIVGTSGAGKSTLISTLLGMHRISEGQVLLDGDAVSQADLVRLRPQVAWVDPDVSLWNRSLFDNLHNGHPDAGAAAISRAVSLADLSGVMARLPQGMATQLGEGGRLLSGGEGQRTRIGRALLQPPPRLVLLDEPLRGLERAQRLDLLQRLRRHFAGTTLLYVSHDISSTLSFAKVAVVEEGRVVEAGPPAVLKAKRGSRYAAMLREEETLRRDLWAGGEWQYLEVREGQVVAGQPPSSKEEEPVAGAGSGGAGG